MTGWNSRPDGFSAAIVLITGAVLGFFAWQTYSGDVPHRYPVAFDTAEWITAPDEGPQAYFRKELYVAGAVQQAWIVVAATDSFVLHLNGKTVDAKGYGSLNVSGIYDLGPLLHVGTNVLGVTARRSSYPGPAMAVVEGAYRDGAGIEHPFASDSSWVVASTEQRQGSGSILWHAESFDAGAWPSAKTSGRPDPAEIYSLPVPRTVFSIPPQGKRIRSSAGPTDRAAYSYDLTLPAGADDAWIRVAAVKPYALTVNGVMIDGVPFDEFQRRRLPGTRITKRDEDMSTDLYRIGSLLRSGPNRIAVSSDRDDAVLTGLFLDGFAVSQGTVLTFGTDSTWAVASSVDAEVGRDTHRYGTVVLMNQGASIESLPAKRVMSLSVPLGDTARHIGALILASLVSAGVMFILWLGTSQILSMPAGVERAEAGRWDAVIHLPVLLILGGAFLLGFDVRFDPGFPFQWAVILIAVAMLLVLKAGLILAVRYRSASARRDERPISSEAQRSAGAVYLVALLVLIAVGATLRLWGLDRQSLYHDEVHMVNFVQGLLDKGYPYKMIGPIERPLATYELVPYPIALSALLFGFNDFALRLPSALFGIMTIPLIYFVGWRIFDRRVGLLAAAVYTFCPQAIVWSKYLWHPQQTQFFALLTSYLFYRAIRKDILLPRYLYLSALSFIVTYLSWEGAGFLLPGLLFGLLAVKRTDFSWIREKHLWGAAGLVGVVVAAQLIRRLLQQVPYMVVGAGLSDVSLPTLFFLDPMYDPWVYLRNFFWLENNAVLTVFLVCGLPFMGKQRGMAYFGALLLVILFMMTNFIPHSAVRYAYYLQTFLILTSSAAIMALLDRAVGVGRLIDIRWDRIFQATMVSATCVMVVLGSSLYLKLYRVNGFADPSGVYTRSDAYYIDYRAPARYLNNRYRQGDLVISVVPNALEYYADIPTQYFVEHYTARQVVYDPSESSPRYMERTVGVPVLRNASDLQEVLAPRHRTWVIAVPYTLFSRLSGSEVISYVEQRGKVVYESYNARVYLLEN